MAGVAELSYGTVKGRFVAGVGDSVDGDVDPDIVPMSGKVTFTATAPVIRVTTAAPDPITIFPRAIECSLDSEGYLTWNGVRGVKLWATDDPDGNPVGWQWTVSFQLDLAGTPVTYLGWNFELPAGTTVDLTDNAPLLTPSAGTIIIQGDGGPAGPVGPMGPIKIYANLTEVAAVQTKDVGWCKVDNYATAFPDLNNQYFVGSYMAGWVLFETYVSNAYSSSPNLPPEVPTAQGDMVQVAKITDGYGTDSKLYRFRSWSTGSQTWGAWGTWRALPIPTTRPSNTGLWKGGGAAGGQSGWSGDGWVALKDFIAADSSDINLQAVTQYWETMFGPMPQTEDGKLQMKSASYAFEGILDGTRTDVGTAAFAARANNRMGRTARVEWTAAAAGVNAVAGMRLALPTNCLTVAGFALHLTFALTGGQTAATRFIAGLAFQSAAATLLTDVDIATSQPNFIGVGKNAADTSLWQWGVSQNRIDMAHAYSAGSDQIIDLKLVNMPNSNQMTMIVSIKTAIAATFKYSNTNVVLPWNADMAIVLRAGAGGTSATPKISLMRCRLGVGTQPAGGF